MLLDVAGRLAREVSELRFLLTGPARGYVAAGLERLGIPFEQVRLPDLDAVARAYRAIDLCLVTSRDEGGPKAVLESMATGVPLVTTRVGQAADLVRDGRERLAARGRGRRGAGRRGGARRRRAPSRARARRRSRARDRRREFVGGAPAPLARAARRLRGDGESVRRLTRVAIGFSRPARGEIAVFYGHRKLPAPGDPVEGGMVKFQRLQTTFPNRPRDFNLLYLGSSSLPSDEQEVIRLAERRRAPVVVNQNGVAYPGWAGERTDEMNERLRAVLVRTGARRLPERVLQARRRPLSRRAARQLGDPAQRRRHDRVHACARAAGGRAGAAARRRPDGFVPSRDGAADTRAAARGTAPRHRHGLRQRPPPGGRARPREPCPFHRGGSPSGRRRRSTGARTCSCTRR